MKNKIKGYTIKGLILFILLLFLLSNIYIAKAEELTDCGSINKNIQFHYEITDDMSITEKIKCYISNLSPAASFRPERNMLFCADSMSVGSFGSDVRMSIKNERYSFTEGETFKCYAFIYNPYRIIKIELYRFNEGNNQWILIDQFEYTTNTGDYWGWVNLNINEEWSDFGRYKLISYNGNDKDLERTFEISKEEVMFNLADESRNGFVNENLIVKFDKTIPPKKELNNYDPEYTFYLDNKEYSNIKLSHNDVIQTTMVIPTEGEHTIKLKFTAKRWINNMGYVNAYYYTEDVIYIENKPTEFMIDLPNICNANENFEIKPTIISQGSSPIVKYKIDYGNGVIKEFNSYDKLIYAYNQEGNYIVTVTAIDSNNNEYSVMSDINVYFIDNIVSLYNPSSARVNEKFYISFNVDQKGSYDIIKARIDFGNNVKEYDISNINKFNTYYSYNTNGNKLITATLYDSNNNVYETQSAILIKEINSKYDIDYDPIIVINKDFKINIKIKEQGSYAIKKYIINYGDGSTKEYNVNNIGSYVYKNGGKFNLKIIACDESGKREEIFNSQINVLTNVNPVFYAVFNINGLNLTTNVILQDKGINEFKNIEIDYDDGNIKTYDTMKNITYQYSNDDTYKVKVKYIDSTDSKFEHEYQIILDKLIVNNNINVNEFKEINTNPANTDNVINFKTIEIEKFSYENVINLVLVIVLIMMLVLIIGKKTKK